MTDKISNEKPGKTTNNESTAPAPPADAADFASLWLDPGLGDGITDTSFHTIVVGKPKDFFWTVPDPAYRRRTEIYTHKPEGAIEEQHYIIAPAMRGLIEEARPCTIVTVIYRDGTPRLWPISSPRDGERDNEAWISARKAAKVGLSTWTKLVSAAPLLQDPRRPAWLRTRSGFRQAQTAAIRRSGGTRIWRGRHHPRH